MLFPWAATFLKIITLFPGVLSLRASSNVFFLVQTALIWNVVLGVVPEADNGVKVIEAENVNGVMGSVWTLNKLFS